MTVEKEKKPVETAADKTESSLSEEDQILKETLENNVQRLLDPKSEPSLKVSSLENMSKEIRSATSSMTSVPKPLKFLNPFYSDLKTFYEGIKADDFKKSLADMIAVLAMTMAKEGTRECLKFKLEGHREELGIWGHEFIRALSGEISQEFVARTVSEPPVATDELLILVDVIIPFQIQHNSEIEAVDLLLEVSELSKLVDYVDKSNFDRIGLYLIRFAEYLGTLEELEIVMGVAFKIYFQHKQYPDALRIAMRINDISLVEKAMEAAKEYDVLVQQQMALMLGSHKYFAYVNDDDKVNRLVSNENLWEHFQSLGRELNVEDAKTPEDVYKSHLSETSSTVREAAQVESARQNLAATFVNAFVNVGYQKDALMTPEDSKWLYKNKDHGMMSAAASLGMILLWNVNEGMSQIDKYLYSTEFIKAGALLALGLVNCGVRDEVDPALGFLPEQLEDDKPESIRMAAAFGLGLAYAGNPHDDVAEALIPVVADTSAKATMSVVAIAGLSLGLVFAGTANEDVCMAIVQRLMEASDAELDQPIAKMLCVGLGVLFLGKQDHADATIEAVKTVEHKISKFAVVVLESCAFAGSGNVLQVQKLMHLCAQHLDKDGNEVKEGTTETSEAEDKTDAEKEKDLQEAALNAAHQSAAVVGVALVTMGESVGSNMAQRAYGHLLHYGDPAVRRAVPLAIALSSVSNPDVGMIDILSKLTHDGDTNTAMTAIFALGLMGAGTNNSRVAQLLRSLATFYSKDQNPLFMVRLSQGLLHAGKGLVTMSPFHSDRTLMSNPAVAGILAILYCCLDLKGTILAKYHFLLYSLACAIRPRMLLTLDAETMEPLQVKVRVGQAVETVGQAGKPKTITGFQTHSTPVLLAQGDRAELGTEEYEALTSILEGIVLLRKKKKNNNNSETMDTA